MAFKTADALLASEYAAEEQDLQRQQQDFLEAQAKAQSKAEKRAQSKSLWSSLGGTLGGLGLPALLAGTVLSGGIAGPALLAALGAYGGSKLGQGAHAAQGSAKFGLKGMTGRERKVAIADMPKSTGKFMSGKRATFESQKEAERDALKEYQDAANRLLHEGQITGALTSGATAGFGALEALDKLDKTKKAVEVGGSLIPLTSHFGQGPGMGFHYNLDKS